MSIPQTPNPFAVQGNPTVVNAEQHGQAPAQGTVGTAPQAAPAAPQMPGGIPGGAGEMSFSVNYDDVSSNRFATAGIFPLVVIDFAAGVANSGNPKHVVSFTGVEQRHQGKEAQIHLALTPNALWKHQQTMKALGFGVEGQQSFTRSQVVGRCCLGEFIDDTDQNGNPRVSLNSIRPHPAGLGITLSQLQQLSGQGLPSAQPQQGAPAAASGLPANMPR